MIKIKDIIKETNKILLDQLNQLSASVIIPVYNNVILLEQTLYSLTKQSYRNFEVILCDNGSEENIKEVVEKFKEVLNIKLLLAGRRKDGLGERSKMRNLGARKALSNVLIYLDSHMIVENNFIEKYIEYFKDSNNKSVTGMIINQKGHNEDWRIENKIFMLVSGNYAIRKEVLFSIGGWDENYLGHLLEDIDLGLMIFRAGIKHKVAYDIKVYHKNHQREGVDYHDKSSRENEIYFLQKHKDIFGREILKQFFNENISKRLYDFMQLWIKEDEQDRYISEIKEKEKEFIPKISVQMIIFNEVEYFEQAYDSIYNFADEIIIVEGSFGSLIEKYKSKRSTDGTLKILDSLSDHKTKLKVYYRNYDQIAQRQFAREQVALDMDWLFIVDGDEIYKEDDLKNLRKILKQASINVMRYKMQQKVFFLDIKHFCKQRDPLGRLFRLHKGSSFLIDEGEHFNDNEMKSRSGQHYKEKELQLPEDKVCTYHYSFTKNKEKILQKELNYATYDKGRWRKVENWFENIYMKMNSSNVEELGKKYGFHMHDNLIDYQELKEQHPKVFNVYLNKNRFPYCIVPWTRIEFNPNGSVYSCCNLSLPKDCLGNINEQSIEEIWNGEKFKTLRERVYNNKEERCLKCIDSRNNLNISLKSQFFQRIEEIKIRAILITLDFDCNLDCIMCYSKKFKQNVCLPDKFYNELKLYLSDVESLGFGGSATGGGEPLYSKNVDKVLDLIYKDYPHIRISCVSNGLLLSDKIYNNLNKWHCFLFSIDAATKETYDKIRKGGDWNKLMSNIDMMNRKIKESFLKVYIVGLFCVQKLNIHEIEVFKNLCLRKGMIYNFQQVFYRPDLETINKVDLLNINDYKKREKE